MNTQLRNPLVTLILLVIFNPPFSVAFAQGGTWTNAASMPQAAFGLGTAAGTNGWLYAAGGAVGLCSRTAAVFAYNPAANSWATEASLPAAIEGFAMANLNGTLYTIGGESGCGVYGNAQEVSAYNIANNSWASLNPFPFHLVGANAAVVKGTLYVLGGSDPTVGIWTNSVFAYNPTNDSWSVVSFMPSVRQWPEVAVANNIIYVMGGTTSQGLTNTVWSFDPATGNWETNASMPVPVESGSADALGGIIYVTGGITTNAYSSTVEAYNPQTDTWTLMPPLPSPAASAGVAALDGQLYVLGGSQNSDNTVLSSVQVFTPANTPAGPAGLWHLDEGSGMTTADSAGSHPGTLVNSPTWVSGVSSNALEFNGNNQYLELNSGPILGSDSNFTIEAWVKPNGNSMFGRWEVYSEGNNSQTGISLDLWGGGYTGSTYTSYQPELVMDDSQYALAPSALDVNEWHHLAGVLKAGVGGILYVDGQPVATNASMNAASVLATETDLAGYAPLSARYFGGIIDEVQIFDTARTTSQILADYEHYTPPTAVADLAIGETVIPNPVGLNSNATFTITVTNFGPDTANDVIVSNNPSPDLAGVSLIYMSQGTPTNSQTIYVLGSLASNATATVIFTAIAENPSSNSVSTCTVQSSADDPDLSNNTASSSLAILAPPPTITTQPMSQTVSTGSPFMLSVSASGYSPLSYQWQFDGTNIDGATGSSLVLTNASLSDGGKYSVVVSDAQGSVTSTVAVATLINLQVYSGITISGPVGTNYEVDYRNELGNTNWTELTNFELPSNPYLFIDRTSPGINHRFYRVVGN